MIHEPRGSSEGFLSSIKSDLFHRIPITSYQKNEMTERLDDIAAPKFTKFQLLKASLFAEACGKLLASTRT